MATFFTADPHFGHRRIIQYCDRPFVNEDEMDEVLIANWNSVVRPKDVAWILGDVSFREIEPTVKIMNRLNGIKKVVLGNHDKRIRNSAELQRCFDEVLDGLQEKYVSNGHGRHEFMVMCHYPLASWNRSYHGTIHVHGHCHNSIPFELNPNAKRLDVGVDAHNYFPISLEQVIDIVNGVQTGPVPKPYAMTTTP